MTHAELVEARAGNGRLRLTSREIADVERLVVALMGALERRLPRGLEVVELELELGRRRGDRVARERR